MTGPGRESTPDATPARRVVVISNPASGGAASTDELERAVDDAVDASGADWQVEWSPTTEDDPGVGQARDAVQSGAERVIAAGGDGTVRAVLQSVAGSATELAVVPLGTGNLLASNLGLPTGLDAAPAALGSSTRRLDVATVNDETFAVMAGIGFDAEMIRDANSAVKDRLGSVAYVISAARHLGRNRVHTTLSVDGSEVWHGRTAMVLVGNCGEVTGGLEVFPDADPLDGRLDVAVLSADSAREWASVLWRLIRGVDQRDELVSRFRGEHVVVDVERPQPYELDGEDRPPARRLEFAIRPDALEVVTDGTD